MGTPSSWLLCSSDMSPSFFEHFLSFWHNTCSRLILSFCYLSLGIIHFTKQFLIPFSGEWCLETKRCAYYYVGVTAPRLSMDRAREVYMSVHVCLYTFTSVFIFMSTDIYWKSWIHTISNSNAITQDKFDFSTFLYLQLPSPTVRTWLPLSLIYLLVWSVSLHATNSPFLLPILTSQMDDLLPLLWLQQPCWVITISSPPVRMSSFIQAEALCPHHLPAWMPSSALLRLWSSVLGHCGWSPAVDPFLVQHQWMALGLNFFSSFIEM